MTEWQPIETAPKNGTAILLWCKYAVTRHYSVANFCPNIAIGFWDKDIPRVYGYKNNTKYEGRWVSIETEDNGYWVSEYTGWMEEYECIAIDPTHWAMLPEPPKV